MQARPNVYVNKKKIKTNMYKIKKLLSRTNCVIDFAELVCKLTILKIHASAEACMG
jgi:hypothetical protein